MTGRTHAAVGICGATYFLVPKVNLETAIIGLAFVIIGSYAPDADLKVSKSGKIIKDIFYGFLLLLIIYFVLVYGFNYKPLNFMDKDIISKQKLIGTLLIIGSIILGRITGHRKYMHSLLGFSTINYGVMLILKDFVIWFAFGYIMHMILDLFNEKPEALLFPLPLGNVCFSLFSSKGKANNIISVVCYAIFLYKFYEYFCKIMNLHIINMR